MLAAHTARKDKSSRSGVMMRIASLSVAIALGVMIVALAVIGGFRYEIRSDLRGFAADVRLTESEEGSPMPEKPLFVEQLEALPAVQGVARYVSLGGMAKSEDNLCGLQLKGVGEDDHLDWWRSKVIEGELPDFSSAERHKELLLSRSTARALDVGVGDRVEMLFTDGNRPRRDRFKVAGLYHTGYEELDMVTALADVRDVRRLAGFAEGEVSGYDIFLVRGAKAEQALVEVEDLIFECYEAGDDDMASLRSESLAARYPIVFDWLKAHDVNAAVIIIIMLTVLLFNMASAMLIMVLDRTGMIGVLKAQGMRNEAIRKIFLWRAALLYAKGAVWGNLIGFAIVVVQAVWSPIRLDPEGYMLSALPIRVELWWVVALNVGVFAVTLMMMLLPSLIVARFRPDETLKYKQ